MTFHFPYPQLDWFKGPFTTKKHIFHGKIYGNSWFPVDENPPPIHWSWGFLPSQLLRFVSCLAAVPSPECLGHTVRNTHRTYDIQMKMHRSTNIYITICIYIYRYVCVPHVHIIVYIYTPKKHMKHLYVYIYIYITIPYNIQIIPFVGPLSWKVSRNETAFTIPVIENEMNIP